MIQIIYSNNFEPITAVDLPLEVIDAARQHGTVKLKLSFPDEVKFVNLTHKLVKLENRYYDVLTTSDETLALILLPELLPGQRSTYK